jgi:hypothetical protein
MDCVTPPESGAFPNIKTKQSLIPPGTMIDSVIADIRECILCLENIGKVCSRPQQGRTKICTRLKDLYGLCDSSGVSNFTEY